MPAGSGVGRVGAIQGPAIRQAKDRHLLCAGLLVYDLRMLSLTTTQPEHIRVSMFHPPPLPRTPLPSHQRHLHCIIQPVYLRNMLRPLPPPPPALIVR